MARGTLIGMVWGVVVSGIGAGTLSVMDGDVVSDYLAARAIAPALATDGTANVNPEQAVDRDGEGRLPSPESDGPESPATGNLPTPGAPQAVGADTTPLAAPEVGSAPSAPVEAEAGSPADVEVSSEAPVMPSAQAQAPGAPTNDAAPIVIADPAQPPMPIVPDVETPLAEDSGPSIGTPAVSLTEKEPAVPQGRLPSVGGESAADAAEAPAPSGPLEAFAAQVEVADGLPRMAVILIDDGFGPIGPEDISAFPFPVSFAVDPSHPNAAQAMAAYRGYGFEVLSLVSLPEGATASDVEVSFGGAVNAVPEAVAFLEDPNGGVQGNREAAAQATEYAASSGHGLVMLPKGLNTAQQLAAKEGVPSASVFRDFDGGGQDASTIRRTLDKAALRARQDGAAVMLGRMRADTISALVLWGLQDREGQLALVPISTVLRESVSP